MDFSKTKIISILVVCILGLLISLGNFFDLGIFSKNKVHLGLDLKGGSQILLKIDYEGYIKEQLQFTVDELRTEFRKNKIRVIPRLKADVNENNEKETYIVVSATNNNVKEIKKIVKSLNSDLIVAENNDNIEIRYDKNAINKAKYKLLQQSIEIVRKRIDETGTKEPIIQAQGRDRILVQVPGMESPDELKKVLGKTAKMTFHFVNTSIMGDDTLPNNILKMKEMNGDYTYYIEKQVILNGDVLQDANATYVEGKPAVGFKMNSLGSKKFADITKNNIGRFLAIVLDNEVITAPRINTPITGGSGVITGNFTTEEANQTALLLRAGALPAPLSIIEERVVGPSLGEDSIKSGLEACAYGLIIVFIFMLFLYRLFGIISTIVYDST